MSGATDTRRAASAARAGGKRPQREPRMVTSLMTAGARSRRCSAATVVFKTTVPRGRTRASARARPSGAPLASTTRSAPGGGGPVRMPSARARPSFVSCRPARTTSAPAPARTCATRRPSFPSPSTTACAPARRGIWSRISKAAASGSVNTASRSAIVSGTGWRFAAGTAISSANAPFAPRMPSTRRPGQWRPSPARRVLGILGANGAFAELIAVPAANLHPVPETIADREAVFTEPLAAAFEILDQMPSLAGAHAVVLGDGKLGLLVAQVLAGAGAEVVLAGRHETKLARARALGIRTGPPPPYIWLITTEVEAARELWH